MSRTKEPPKISRVQLAVMVEELARGYSKTAAAFKSRAVCEQHGLPSLHPTRVIKHWHAAAEAQAAVVQKIRDEAYRAEIEALVALERSETAIGMTP